MRDAFLKDIIESVCACKKEGAVCGTDGRTYASVCRLKQESASQPDVTVKEWSPCETGSTLSDLQTVPRHLSRLIRFAAPVISSRPENATASINDDLVLGCEVRGYPIPSLIWEFESALTGRKMKLPGTRRCGLVDCPARR